MRMQTSGNHCARGHRKNSRLSGYKHHTEPKRHTPSGLAILHLKILPYKHMNQAFCSQDPNLQTVPTLGQRYQVHAKYVQTLYNCCSWTRHSDNCCSKIYIVLSDNSSWEDEERMGGSVEALWKYSTILSTRLDHPPTLVSAGILSQLLTDSKEWLCLQAFITASFVCVIKWLHFQMALNRRLQSPHCGKMLSSPKWPEIDESFLS